MMMIIIVIKILLIITIIIMIIMKTSRCYLVWWTEQGFTSFYFVQLLPV